tara:strand:- start:1115 stop:1402 length:288 start_codon:yes stop_codon:yes gene_type:complete
MKITKRQLRKIIREEKAKLAEGRVNSSVDISSSRDELLALATYATRAVKYFEEQAAQFDGVLGDAGPDGLSGQVEDIAYRLMVLARNARSAAKDV